MTTDSAAGEPNRSAQSPASESPGGGPPGGWLRAARLARGVPQQTLATKLGFKRQAWAQLEASEARGAISLYSLRRAADALGYDLVYYLVPKQGASRAAGATRGPHTPSRDGTEGEVAATRAEATTASGKWAETELPTELR